jgi:hypothetical protein
MLSWRPASDDTVNAALSWRRELELRSLTITVLDGHPHWSSAREAPVALTSMQRGLYIRKPRSLCAVSHVDHASRFLIVHCSERGARTCLALTESMANNDQWLAIQHKQFPKESIVL